MSGSSAGLTLSPGNGQRVKSESSMDDLMGGEREDTREPSLDSMISEDAEESEGAKKLRKKREVCSGSSVCPGSYC